MAIMWATYASTATSTVAYGTSPGSLNSVATGTSKSYMAVGVTSVERGGRASLKRVCEWA
jgi:hypothetical protein